MHQPAASDGHPAPSGPSAAGQHLFWALALALLAAAFATRLWGLGARPFHQDEAYHARAAWDLAQGAGYRFNPKFHGPFLYYLTAATFRLLGDSDYAARLSPALCGVALCTLVLFSLRRWLGSWGALFAALFVVASPATACYQRYLFHDSYILLFSLAMVVAYLRLAEGGSREFYYLFALAAACGLCTKANIYFVLFAIGAYDYALAWGRCLRARREERRHVKLSWAVALSAAGVALAAAVALWALRAGNAKALGTAAACALAFWLCSRCSLSLLAHRLAGGASPWPVARDWPAVLLALALAFALYAGFYTNGFREPRGVFAGVGEMLGYWLRLQQQPKILGPASFYLLLLVLYELPTALAGFLGAVWCVARPTLARGFFAWWALASILLYSMANEKVPWLVVHIVLPLGICAGGFLAHAFSWAGARKSAGRRVARAALALFVALGLGFLCRGAYAILGPQRTAASELLLYVQTTDAFLRAVREHDPGPAPRGEYNVAVSGDAAWILLWYYRGRPGVLWWLTRPRENLRLIIRNKRDKSFSPPQYAVQRVPILGGTPLLPAAAAGGRGSLLSRLRSELSLFSLRKIVRFVLFREPLGQPVYNFVYVHYRVGQTPRPRRAAAGA